METNIKLFKSSIPWLIFFLALVLFSYQFDSVKTQYFDEIHYVRAAQDWLNMAPVTNLEHPPLGKYLISFGIKVFGDNPLGWRAASLLFGSLSILSCYLIATLLFENLAMASLVAVVSLFNFWFFTESRIAMIDIFLVSFILAGMYFYLKYFLDQKKESFFYLAAICLGLAISIKWSALFLIVPISLFKPRKIIQFGLVVLGIYFLTFIPYMFVTSNYKISFLDIFFVLPFKMYDLQTRVPAEHPYMSAWYTWPFMLRPIWFDYKSISSDPAVIQGIVLLGNPLQMFLGFISFLHLSFSWKKINHITKAILITFVFSWLAWAISSRKLTFFYYFFPCAVCYSFLIPISFIRLFGERRALVLMSITVLLSFVLFLFFYPLISGTPIFEKSRGALMWLQSWN